MELVDTHCHIHFSDYPLDTQEVISSAHEAGVTRLLCVGCTLDDSRLAVRFVRERSDAWASIGLHPHEANRYVDDHLALQAFRDLATKPRVVAIGEIGLDYYYEHSSRSAQERLLRFQLDIASEHNLPLIFHVRNAFDDFWPIVDSYSNIRGVVHSFSAGRKELEQILARNLYVGLNGIMTFTKDPEQLAAAKAVPLQSLMLETDAPFLTPVPFRGKICEPKYVRTTAEFLSQLKEIEYRTLAEATTANARQLFGI